LTVEMQHELLQLLGSSDAAPGIPRASPIAADSSSSLSCHVTAELWCWEQLEPQHGQVPLAALPASEPRLSALGNREGPDRRWQRKVREERRVLHASEIDGLSAVALRSYLRGMGVTVSTRDKRSRARLKAMMVDRMMGCAVWRYDPGAEGRPKTPCPRRVVDRYMCL
jgi:hypothetical protein